MFDIGCFSLLPEYSEARADKRKKAAVCVGTVGKLFERPIMLWELWEIFHLNNMVLEREAMQN